MIRRDASVLPPSLQFGQLERHVVRHSVPHIPEIASLSFPLVDESALLRRFLLRRLESSEAALIESVRRQLHFYERALAAIAAGRSLRKCDYRMAFGHEQERTSFQEVLFWELFAPAGSADPLAIHAEMRRLEKIVAVARALPGAKRQQLAALLRNEREPALVFTTSAATARDLSLALAPAHRCGLVTARERTRDLALRDFRSGRIDVLVTTELAAEGLDLQRAGLVVHYDIPWNPARLDQRNGRACRIGQLRDTVRAVYFVPQERESGIMSVIARKTRLRHRTFTGQAPSSGNRSTMRPRLTAGAAYQKLRATVKGDLPDTLARRHKAGVEMLIEQMSGEWLDPARIDWLVDLVQSELG